jgi:hypothetical protein
MTPPVVRRTRWKKRSLSACRKPRYSEETAERMRRVGRKTASH